MTAWLLALVPSHGAALVAIATFLSCLALPVPSSLVMLAGGAFAAAGDLGLMAVAGAALGGALAGDQAGYALGRAGPVRRMGRLSPALMAEARGRLARGGWGAVFLTRWLFSPLGPWVNLAAGMAGMPWRRFSTASAAGEAVWVAIYTGLGWIFMDRIDALGASLGQAAGAASAALIAFLAGRALLRAGRRTARG
jgi:membrane protein DedA with SNARE-associated domain